MKRIMPYIPEELIEEILLRLSPESLIECKQVCKAWYSLIRDPRFVNNHLHTTIDDDKTSVSMFFGWVKQELSLNDIFDVWFQRRRYRNQILSLVTISNKDDGNGDFLPCVVEPIELPPIPDSNIATDILVSKYSHCNGIICMTNVDLNSMTEAIVLCNPASRELKLVPRLPVVPKFVLEGCGFGYDVRADDYKYIRLLLSRNRNIVCKALIYSLRADSWREIKIEIEIEIEIDVGNGGCNGLRRGVYFSGVYYWWCGPIITFDMSTEEVKTLKLPDAAAQGSDWESLAVWNESLALFLSRENSWFSTSFEMWVMKSKEGSASWTRHLTIGPLARVHSPLAFWKDDELLMETRDGLVVSYNIDTKKTRKLRFPGAILPGTSQAGFYLKSVVSLERSVLNPPM